MMIREMYAYDSRAWVALSFDSSLSKLSPTESQLVESPFGAALQWTRRFSHRKPNWRSLIGYRAWAFCSGRLSQLPRAAINLGFPELIDHIESSCIEPDIDVTIIKTPQRDHIGHTKTILYQFGLLSQIVNESVPMFYDPRERCTKSMLLQLNSKYVH